MTICQKHYILHKPLHNRIAIINKLYDEGHTIVYWTARGTTSGENHSKITREQLIKWGAKFHQLELKKPMYDLFICDKAINSKDYFE